jgi:hypothetical protein
LLEGEGIEVIEGSFDSVVDDIHDHSVDIIHLDGDHRLQAVVNDIEKWIPKLKKNGVFLMHDVWNPAFYGPLYGFTEGIKAYRLMFLKGYGLGVSTMDTKIMEDIYKHFPGDLVPQPVFEHLLKYVEVKNLWIKALSESSVREVVVKDLEEKTDLLSTAKVLDLEQWKSLNDAG